jgi:hypothetical protein
VKRRAVFLALAVAAACIPDVPSNDALVGAPRILAVRAEPAEARPGAPVTYTPLVGSALVGSALVGSALVGSALVGSAAGAVPSPVVVWAYCLAPTPLTDDNAVSTACLDAGSLDPLGAGATITGAVPVNACSLFGPVAPPGGGRPRDPDTTGGYYQPLRVDLAGAVPAFALERIACDLANAPAAQASAFAKAYTANANPQLMPLVATTAGAPVAFDAIVAGSRVDLTASWPAASAETYAYYDAAANVVTSRREAMQLAWYASAGAVDRETTGRGEDDPATTSDDAWTAPGTPGPARLWVVLRDSRGGVDFASYDVTVRAR